MNFNEQVFLCHYGIKGMKWGIRRYQNKDGSLTKLGLQRYGSKKGLKKAIKAQTKKAKKLADEGMILQKAFDKAEKRKEKAAEKFLKRDSAKNELNYLASMGSYTTIKKQLDSKKSEMKEHYKSLVKEFGKENVNDLSIDKFGKLNEKTDRDKKAMLYILAFGWTATFSDEGRSTKQKSAIKEQDEYNRAKKAIKYLNPGKY